MPDPVLAYYILLTLGVLMHHFVLIYFSVRLISHTEETKTTKTRGTEMFPRKPSGGKWFEINTIMFKVLNESVQ